MKFIGSNAPKWPFRLNKQSPFHQNLLACYPLSSQPHPAYDLVQGKIVGDSALGGTFNSVPIPDLNVIGADNTITNNLSPRDNGFTLPNQGGICMSFWGNAPANQGFSHGLEIGANGSDRVWFVYPGPTGRIIFDYGNNTTGEIATAGNFLDAFYNQWHHVVLWAEGDSGNGEGMGIQFDGEVVATKVTTTTPTTLTPLQIGNRASSPIDSERNLHKMAFLSIWNGSKTEGFRKALYNPATRWDLYDSGPTVFIFPDASTSKTRRSSAGLLKIKPGVTPNVAKDVPWRLTAARMYCNIAVDAPVAEGDDLATKVIHLGDGMLRISGG